MRLDHLLSMETGTGCHDPVIRVKTRSVHRKQRIDLLLFNFQGPAWSLKRKEPVVWGCSSVGRAPALQAGGHGFESHHLHQRTKSAFTTRGSSEGNPKFIPDGIGSLRSKQGTRVIHTRVRKMGKNQHRVTVCSSGG